MLTDEQIEQIASEMEPDALAFARAIEKAVLASLTPSVQEGKDGVPVGSSEKPQGPPNRMERLGGGTPGVKGVGDGR